RRRLTGSLGGDLGRWRAACRPPAIHFGQVGIAPISLEPAALPLHGRLPDGRGRGRAVQDRAAKGWRRAALEETIVKTHHLAVMASAGLAAAPLFAQPAQAPSPPSTRAEMEQSIQQRFAMRDANHDGFLTADELGDRAPMMMAQLDADHDGK